MDRAELKNKAKTLLKGKYNECIKLSFCTFGILISYRIVITILMGVLKIFPNSLIYNIIDIIGINLVMSFIGFGVISFYKKISCGIETTYQEILSKKDLFLSYLSITAIIFAFTFLWTFIYMFLFFCLSMILAISGLKILILLCSILLIIPIISCTIKYSFSYFIKFDNPNISAFDAVKSSAHILKGHKFEYFILSLSFFGWSILCVFTFGIGFLWLMPYIMVTTILFYNQLSNQNQDHSNNYGYNQMNNQNNYGYNQMNNNYNNGNTQMYNSNNYSSNNLMNNPNDDNKNNL